MRSACEALRFPMKRLMLSRSFFVRPVCVMLILKPVASAIVSEFVELDDLPIIIEDYFVEGV